MAHKNQNDIENSFLHEVIADAIETIVTRAQKNLPCLSLDELASKAGYSTPYFQKTFSTHTGLSPTTFARYLQYNKASSFLLEGHSTLESAYNAGLSGNGRLHELYVSIDAVTPGQYARKGVGLNIHYGTITTPIGKLCLGLSSRGICWAAFNVEGSDESAINAMKKFWKEAQFHKATDYELTPIAQQLDMLWRATSPSPDASARQKLSTNPLKIYLEGTNFQVKIWQALLMIPSGGCVDYGSIGHYIGAPKSGRAIGNAVGANPVAWIIPCHRVIRKGGIIHNYAWRPERKKSLLSLEQSHTQQEIPFS